MVQYPPVQLTALKIADAPVLPIFTFSWGVSAAPTSTGDKKNKTVTNPTNGKNFSCMVLRVTPVNIIPRVRNIRAEYWLLKATNFGKRFFFAKKPIHAFRMLAAGIQPA